MTSWTWIEMQSRGFIRALETANRWGMGRRVTKHLIDQAYKAVDQVDNIDGVGMAEVYGRLMKPNNQVSDEFRDALLEKFKLCPECEIEPVLDPDDYEGYWNSDRSYCSGKCQREAHDTEYDRACDWCDQWYSTEQGGYYVMSHECCSEDCAWDMLINDRYAVRPFFEKHPEVDEDATLEAVRQDDEWTRCESEREMTELLAKHAVGTDNCAICDESSVGDEGDGRFIDDLDEWYCSDRHVWEGIADFLSDRTGKLWSAYQAQQLLKGYVLYEFEDAGNLKRAVDEVLK